MREAAQASIQRMEDARRKERESVRETGKETGWLHRRTALDIPYHTVEIDLAATSDPAVPGEVAADADEEQ